MKKLKSLCVMPIALETMLGMGTFLNTVSAQEPSIPIKAHAYELDDKSSYDFSSASEVSSMTFGKKTLGEFSILMCSQYLGPTLCISYQRVDGMERA